MNQSFDGESGHLSREELGHFINRIGIKPSTPWFTR